MEQNFKILNYIEGTNLVRVEINKEICYKTKSQVVGMQRELEAKKKEG